MPGAPAHALRCSITSLTTESNAMANDIIDTHNANLDPISGAPGSHPIGTGTGALAGGAAAGAAAGAVAGPAGAIAGAIAGAVVGGLAGKAVAEYIDPTAEEAYWRENFEREPYYDAMMNYEDYSAAYRTGWEGRGRYRGHAFEQAETDLQRDYERNRGNSRLGWDRARSATRAAWERIELPEDSDGNRK